MIQPKLTRERCMRFIEEHLFSPKSISGSAVASEAIGKIGIELETFPVIRDDKHRFGVAPVRLFGHEDSLINLVSRVATEHGGQVIGPTGEPSDQTKPVSVDKIVFPNGDLFQFEPGGQIEISTAPCNSISELQDHLDARKTLLYLVTTQHQIHFAQFGTNPWLTVGEIRNQLHKPRYLALERYFDSLGPYGKQMMLQTCSLHINLDLGLSPATRVKRIVAANLLVPYVTALFAHSPFIAGTNTGHKAYRSYLWQHLDACRTGIFPWNKIVQTMDSNDILDAYLEMAMKASVIYIRAISNRVFPKEVTMQYWMQHGIEGVWPDLADFEHHLTLLFPEVRLKGYLEIRSVDAPPSGWEMIPVAFYTGLLYSDKHLDSVLDFLQPCASRINALHAEATYGLASDELFLQAKSLMELAIDGYQGLPESFKQREQQKNLSQFYECFTLRRKTFADEALEADIFNKFSVS